MAKRKSVMYGVLVDVSGSMRSAYEVEESKDTTVSRAHAIFTTILNIAKCESNSRDNIFVGAFGVSVRSITTCDLFGLLKKATRVPEELKEIKPGVEGMVQIAIKEGYIGAVNWIRKELSEDQAKDLYRLMCIKPSIRKELLSKLPSNGAAAVVQTYDYAAIGLASLISPDAARYFQRNERSRVRNSEAYQYAESLIERKEEFIEEWLVGIQNLIPLPTPSVVELFQELKLDENDPRAGSSESVRKNIDDTLESIQPYIYGGTPMCKAMKDALMAFRDFKSRNPGQAMTLLILTDGQSGDGNPIDIADQLKQLGVVIVTCYLTAEDIKNQYCCHDSLEESSVLCPALLQMSSTMHNNDYPMHYLAESGWKLSLSGESQLYVEANTLEIVDEMCKKVISELNNPCGDDAMNFLNTIHKQYMISDSLEKFEPKKQKYAVCYAHAVAAVVGFALHRIVGREGGYPAFKDLRKELIKEFGKNGADTKIVLDSVCEKYRLKYVEVDEMGARSALNFRRPLVTTFEYPESTKELFQQFFQYNSRGILQKQDLKGDSSVHIGHAVVLVKAYPNCLKFANSWGPKWGDEGFFKIQDSKVLDNMKFYDVFWDVDDLEPAEKREYLKKYREEGNKRFLEWGDKYKSLKKLPFQCPNCNEIYEMCEFSGNYEEAICPNEQCSQRTFKPNYKDLGKTLYLREYMRR